MSSEICEPTRLSGLSLLIEWANAQDNWIRKLVAEVVATKNALPEESIESLLQYLLQEKGLAEGGCEEIPPISGDTTSVSQEAVVHLKSLKNIENVNALEPGQEIEFNPKMTLFFGENGSGKTGYVRVFKQAAGVRTAEQILPDVRNADVARALPSALFEVNVGGVDLPIAWRGEQGIQPLTTIDVFDSQVSLLHLEEDLTYSYTPQELALFPLVMDGLEKIRNKLQASIEAKRPEGNPFLGRLERENRFFHEIEGLKATTDISRLEGLSQILEEAGCVLPELREKIEALRLDPENAILERTERQHAFLTEVSEIIQAIEDFDQSEYGRAIAALGAARSAQEQSTGEALKEKNIPGVLSEPWRKFIEAAEGYIKSSDLDPYPGSGHCCIYCRQPLNDVAISLIQKYRDYCNDAFRIAIEEASGKFQSVSESLINMNLKKTLYSLESQKATLADMSPKNPCKEMAEHLLAFASSFQEAVRSEQSLPVQSETLSAEIELLRKTLDSLDKTLSDLRKEGEDRASALSECQSSLSEFEERKLFRDLMPEIKNHVEKLQWLDLADSFMQKFQNLKRSLTDTAKRASNEVLNRDFQRFFEEECQNLKAPSVSLDFPGRSGETRRRKLISREHGLCKVLSEGEQKVIALADFLAETSIKPEGSPLLLDDPVTSLDHKRLRYVVDRLVNLSERRQVVIFSHDIWFMAEILARFEHKREACTFYDVRSEGEKVGLVSRGSSPRTDTFTNRKARINSLISKAEINTGEEQQTLVEKGYEELRGACEIIVEDVLLRGAVERFRPNIRMTVLEQIRADRLQSAIEKVVAIFGTCCRNIASHSQPLTALGIRPSLHDLKADWEELKRVKTEYER